MYLMLTDIISYMKAVTRSRNETATIFENSCEFPLQEQNNMALCASMIGTIARREFNNSNIEIPGPNQL